MELDHFYDINCSYLNPNELGDNHLGRRNSELSIFQANVRSLNANLDSICDVFQNCEQLPDVLAITETKYDGYIQKQFREITKTKKQNRKKIPKNTNYSKINGLSNEVKEKLNTNQPDTIGSAANIEGVTPAAINLILIQLKKNEMQKQNA